MPISPKLAFGVQAPVLADPLLSERPKRATLMERLAADPLLVDPDRLSMFEACVAHLEQHELAAAFGLPQGMAADQDFWSDRSGAPHPWRPYVVQNGILQIPVLGSLYHRFPYQLGSWATGYDYIEQALARGIADPAVRGIALVVDSPGGMVAGCFELADKIYEARAKKPIRAFASDSAYSAAYALASSAERITVTRSGGVGSVGVVAMHVDFSKMLDNDGVKITLVFAGAHKVDGNPFEKLPAGVRNRIQARVDKSYAVFVSTVARNRDMGEDAVRATEALTYDAQDSVTVGFADAVGALEDEAAKFAEEMQVQETDQMTDKNTTAPDAAALAAATEEGRSAGHVAGMADQKARISAIITGESAKDRPAAALAAALDTDMTAEQAAAFLAKLPKETPQAAAPAPAPANPLASAMETTPNPQVGTLATENEDEDDGMSAEAKEIASILGASAASTGVPLKQ